MPRGKRKTRLLSRKMIFLVTRSLLTCTMLLSIKRIFVCKVSYYIMICNKTFLRSIFIFFFFFQLVQISQSAILALWPEFVSFRKIGRDKRSYWFVLGSLRWNCKSVWRQLDFDRWKRKSRGVSYGERWRSDIIKRNRKGGEKRVTPRSCSYLFDLVSFHFLSRAFAVLTVYREKTK